MGPTSRNVRQKHSGTKAPWLDAWGNPLPTNELQEVSAFWSRAVWDEYLRSIELPLKEKLGLAADSCLQTETYAHQRKRGYRKRWRGGANFDQAGYFGAMERSEAEEEEDELHLHLRMGVRSLTHAEYSVIIKYYWEGMSEYAIARILRRTRSTVQTLRHRAIERLRTFLLAYAPVGEIRRRYRNFRPKRTEVPSALVSA